MEANGNDNSQLIMKVVVLLGLIVGALGKSYLIFNSLGINKTDIEF